MEQLIQKLFSDFGVTATLLVIIILFALKYLPKIFKEFLNSIKNITMENNNAQEKAQEAFSRSLDLITEKNKMMVDGFLSGMNKLSQEHKEQFEMIKAFTGKQEEIHEYLKNKLK